MNKIGKKVLSAAAKISRKTAIKSCGATSFIGCYQPVEPKLLKTLKK